MQSLAENLPLLLVSASARALAQSAVRAGVPVVVLDLFNDLDARALAVASRGVAGRNGRLDSRRLLAAAQELCPPERCAGLVYGSGLEGRTRLLARLSNGRTLFGNRPETVAMLKDPARFFPLLDSLGIAHPEVRLHPPAEVAGWLVKRTGGAGGGHVRQARSQHRARAHRYFQRFQPGRTLSVLFAADGRRARVIGFNEQWTAGAHCAPYSYGGAVSQTPLPQQTQRRIASLLDDLVQASGLVGLNGVDFILSGEMPFVIEVNPRPTATIDLYDADFRGGLLALHLCACGGEMVEIPATANVARAHAIVYASVAIRVPVGVEWPEWCTDLPEGRSVIPVGAPVCSVHAQAATSAAARELVFARRGRLEDSLWEQAA